MLQASLADLFCKLIQLFIVQCHVIVFQGESEIRTWRAIAQLKELRWLKEEVDWKGQC